MATFQDDIRRIAREPKIKGGLNSKQERDPIKGSVTPFENKAMSQDSSVGATNDKGEESPVGGDKDPNDPTTNGQLVPSDQFPNGSNGGSGNGGNGSDSYDADDLLDDKAGPTIPDGTVGTDDLLPNSSGALKAIEGLTDCASGQGVNLRLDGAFIPPDGWDDPDVPPVDPTFERGFYWRASGYPYSISNAATANEAAAIVIADMNTRSPGLNNDAGITNCGDYYAVYGGTYGATSTCWKIINGVKYVGGSFYEIKKTSCGGSVVGVCNPSYPAPTDDAWPVDGNYDLALKDGQFESSQYDSEAPPKEPTSAVHLCTADGRFVTIRAASNGGSIIYETTTSGGPPKGTMKVYNSDGTMRMAGDATQTNINSQLPR